MREATRQVTRRVACGAGLAAALLGMTGCSSDRTTHPRSHGVTTRPVRTIHRGQVIVSGSVPTARLRTVADEAARAVQLVRDIWGPGVLKQQLSIKVAADDAQFRDNGGNGEVGAQIAATTTPDGVVVLAPSLFSEVTAAGRVVVLTHELTHVALHQATLSGVPHWVIEGSAEFTAYAASGKTLATLAPQLAAAVRGGAVPTGPPGDREFTDDPVMAYQSALAWCRFLAGRFGRSALVSFVRAADAKRPAAFAATFHTSAGALGEPYTAYLRAELAGGDRTR